jgi:hypothetical protein
LAHDIKKVPPFEYSGEAILNEPGFGKECAEEIRIIAQENPDIEIMESRISKEPRFGLVYRADFKTEYDEENSVNRIMIWKLRTGEIASFMGLNIPASPLKRLSGKSEQ